MPANSTIFRPARNSFLLHARKHRLALGPKTHIMGILNMTPDSFSGDGCLSTAKAIQLARRQIQEGADIIDVGGESSRPGADKISIKTEIDRIVPTISQLAKLNVAPISIDTYKAEVAQAALEAGASIVNNIHGTPPNTALLKIVKRHDAAIILMHMRGTAKTMQKKAQYKKLIPDILGELKSAIEKCLEIGIKSDKIIIDPGIGFAKTSEHNLEILNHLQDFSKLKLPILVGSSRKSFIGKILNHEPGERLYGTLASVIAAVMNGAHIVRVHDIKPVKEALLVADSILNS